MRAMSYSMLAADQSIGWGEGWAIMMSIHKHCFYHKRGNGYRRTIQVIPDRFVPSKVLESGSSCEIDIMRHCAHPMLILR
jgi:hypothetical protein